MTAEYRPCSRCGLSTIHFRSTATLCDDCRGSHNEGSCDLCTGYHDAEEVAFMNRSRRVPESEEQATVCSRFRHDEHCAHLHES